MTTALFAACRTHATNIHAQHIYTQRSYIHKAHTNTALFYITHNTTHIDADFFCRRWFPDFVALLKSKGVAPATEPLATVRCPPLRLARVSVCLCLCVFCQYVRLCVMLRRFSGNISLSIPQLYLSPSFLAGQVSDYAHWLRLARLYPRQYDGWLKCDGLRAGYDINRKRLCFGTFANASLLHQSPLLLSAERAERRGQ